jgi:hypothetical protein
MAGSRRSRLRDKDPATGGEAIPGSARSTTEVTNTTAPRRKKLRMVHNTIATPRETLRMVHNTTADAPQTARRLQNAQEKTTIARRMVHHTISQTHPAYATKTTDEDRTAARWNGREVMWRPWK